MRTIQAAAQKVAVRRQEQYRERPRPKKRLRVVEDKKRSAASSPEIPFPVFVLSVTVVTAGLILNVAQQALVSQLSYETESVKKQIQLAQQEQENLLAQKAWLESPLRIETIATRKLSMVKAPKISYLRVALDAPKAIVSRASGK